MPAYAVRVWVRQRAVLGVEADSAQEALQKAASMTGSRDVPIGADINGPLTIDGVRKGPVRLLSASDFEWLNDHLDNDRGVPFEDYEPGGFNPS